VQVALFRDDEDPIRPNEQAIRNQFHRHRRKARENLVKLSGEGPHMVDDDDGDTHVVGQVLQQPDVCVETASGTANADDRKFPSSANDLHRSSPNLRCHRSTGIMA
jgi:hypothetical protein